MRKNILLNLLSYFIAALSFFTAAIGLFYTTGGSEFAVQNIYGQHVELFGDGIYAYNSIMKAATFKGTDMAILFMIPLLLITTVLKEKSVKAEFLHSGLISCFLYYAASLAFGVSYNRLFSVYLLLFSASLFAFIFSLSNLIGSDNVPDILLNRKLSGTAVYMIAAGCSVLVWLTFIIPSIISGKPISTIEIYTTEPTFIFDLGIILPIAVSCGFMLLKRKVLGYKLTPVLLTLITMVGVCVMCQTMVQLSLGIVIHFQEIVGMTATFVVLGAISIMLNLKFLKYLN